MALSIARPRPLSFVLPPFFLSFAIHFLTGASPRRCATLYASHGDIFRERTAYTGLTPPIPTRYNWLSTAYRYCIMPAD